MALPTLRTAQECPKEPVGDEYVKQFIEVLPFQIDQETGEVLNDTPEIILKETKPKNIQEEIDSYYYDSFQANMERIRKGDQNTPIEKTTLGEFMNDYDLPKNIHELKKAVEKNKENMEKFKEEFTKKQAEEAAAKAAAEEEARRKDDERIKAMINAALRTKGE